MQRRCVLTVAVAQVRAFGEVKGDTTFRLQKKHSEKDAKGALKKYWDNLEQQKPKTFANRKEELAHLAARPSYEYMSYLQRAADDLTAVVDHPQQYVTDVPYHYNKLWKAITMSKTGCENGNGEIEMMRTIPQ